MPTHAHGAQHGAHHDARNGCLAHHDSLHGFGDGDICALLLFAALSRVSRAPNNLGIRGFPGPINALKVAFKRGDGSWKEWTQQMLAKNDIGYAIKLRQRIVG